MTPFVSEYFFYILLLLAIPAVFAGFLGKNIKYCGFLATLAFIPLIYNTFESLLFLGIFYLLSLLASIIYSKLGTKNIFVFWCFLILTLSPLIISKAVPGVNWFHFLGISYMTFRTVQFIADIKKGKIEKVKVFDFTYFVLFFPALSSGPIDRFRRFVFLSSEKWSTHYN